MWPEGSDGNGDGGDEERCCDGVHAPLSVSSSLFPGLESLLCRLLSKELE